MYIALLTLTVF